MTVAQQRTSMKVTRRNLLLVAGLAWFGASAFLLSKAIYNLMSDDDIFLGEVTLALILGLTLFVFFFKRMLKSHLGRIMGMDDQFHSILYFMDLKGYIILLLMTFITFDLEYQEWISLDYLFVFQLTMSTPIFLCSLFFFWNWKNYPGSDED